MSYLVSFLGALGILVLFHELGHYSVARACGVRVLTFSIGFGPELWHFHDRHGTRWRLACIPLGGYVRMAGEVSELPDRDSRGGPASSSSAAEAASTRRRETFAGQAFFKKALIVSAGPLANFLLAFLLFAFVHAWVGVPGGGTPAESPGDAGPLVIREVMDDSPAWKAGLRSGDVLVAINQTPVVTLEDLRGALSAEPLQFDVERENTRLRVRVVPELQPEEGVYRLGVVVGIGLERELRPLPPAEALGEGWTRTWTISRDIFQAIGQMFGSEGEASFEDVGGPFRIAQYAKASADAGLENFLLFLAVLSINLAIVNLLPIPVLDGGQLLLLTLEAIRGRPLPPRWRARWNRFGLWLLLGVFTLAFYNDIRFWGR